MQHSITFFLLVAIGISSISAYPKFVEDMFPTWLTQDGPKAPEPVPAPAPAPAPSGEEPLPEGQPLEPLAPVRPSGTGEGEDPNLNFLPCLPPAKEETQMCCGGTVFNKTRMTMFPMPGANSSELVNVTCCGGTWHEEAHQMCCRSAIHPRREGLLCCGTNTFDPRIQTCCPDTAVVGVNDTCAPAILEPSCPNVDLETEICCNGVIHQRWQRSHFLEEDFPVEVACCGSEWHEPEREMCCQDTIQPHDTNHLCCGKTTFDTTSHGCCNDQIVAKEENCSFCEFGILCRNPPFI